MARIGLVIPCFNAGEQILTAIKSVRDQTRAVDQIVVVNDGSTDPDTCDLLAELSAPGLKVVNQSNRGVAGARNMGIEALDADYVFCLDADDKLCPKAVEVCAQVLDEHPEAGIVAGHIKIFGETNDLKRCTYSGTESMLSSSAIPRTTMFRRADWQRVGGYPNLRVESAWAFWMRLLVAGVQVKVVDEVIFEKYTDAEDRLIEKHPISLAKTKNFILREAWPIYRDFPEYVIEDYSQQRLMLALYRRRYGRLETVAERLRSAGTQVLRRRKLRRGKI